MHLALCSDALVDVFSLHPFLCGTRVMKSDTPHLPRSMNNGHVPYVSACKTRSPTVGPGKPRGLKGWPRGFGGAAGWEGGLSRTGQAERNTHLQPDSARLLILLLRFI